MNKKDRSGSSRGGPRTGRGSSQESAPKRHAGNSNTSPASMLSSTSPSTRSKQHKATRGDGSPPPPPPHTGIVTGGTPTTASGAAAAAGAVVGGGKSSSPASLSMAQRQFGAAVATNTNNNNAAMGGSGLTGPSPPIQHSSVFQDPYAMQSRTQRVGAAAAASSSSGAGHHDGVHAVAALPHAASSPSAQHNFSSAGSARPPGRIRPTSSTAARAAASAAGRPPTSHASVMTASPNFYGAVSNNNNNNMGGTDASQPAAVVAFPQQQQQQQPQPPLPGTRDQLERPPYALSLGIMSVYKHINVRFCTETRRRLPGSSHDNNGYDDREGHYLPIIGEEIDGRYTVQDVLGKGSFGTVLRCCDEKYQLPVAVKLVRRGAYFEAQGRLEAEIVAYLNRIPSLESLVVQLRKVLIWKEHFVLVFELLSFDLYQLIRCTKYNGVSLDLTRKFALQLLRVFSQLEQHNPPIIHCDLKPENVLLRDPSRSGIRVIDFGSACYEKQAAEAMPYVYERTRLAALQEAHHGRIPLEALCAAVPQASVLSHMPKYVQSRFYRSPEVILELGYTSAIDRWSLACMLVELHTGVPLFPGRNEADMLALFTAVLGPLPVYMVTASPKRAVFYNLTPTSGFAAAAACTSPRTGLSGGDAGTCASVHANANALGSEASVPFAVGYSGERASALAAADHDRVHSAVPAGASPSACASPPVSSVDGAGASQATSFFSGGGGAGSAIYAQGSSASLVGMATTAGTATTRTFAGWAVPHREGRHAATRDAQGGPSQPSPSAAVPMSPMSTTPALPTRGCCYPSDARLQLWSGPQDHNKAALTSLKETLGVYSGGPRGCRKEQKGHEPAAYECFLDFILKLLTYDPGARMTCTQALEHPFLKPLLELEAAAQRQEEQQQQQQQQQQPR